MRFDSRATSRCKINSRSQSTARVHLPSLFRRTKRTHHRCRTTTCTRRLAGRVAARLHVPGPVGVHRARGAAKFCALGVGDPTSTSPGCLSTPPTAQARARRARARATSRSVPGWRRVLLGRPQCPCVSRSTKNMPSPSLTVCCRLDSENLIFD